MRMWRESMLKASYTWSKAYGFLPSSNASAARREDSSYFGISIRTTSELVRIRSNTICFPSGVMSNVRSAP
jgi:hypothetical protein